MSLKSPSLANPKLKPAENPKSNREWTVYSDTNEVPAEEMKGNGRKAMSNRPASKASSSPGNIRARKNTQLDHRGDKLRLTLTGDDPGIAMDLREVEAIPNGPYELRFDLTTSVKDGGEVFFTVDKQTSLPHGQRIEFAIDGSNTPQAVMISIDTELRLHQLRIDIGNGPGTAILSKLRLLSGDGQLILDWSENH